MKKNILIIIAILILSLSACGSSMEGSAPMEPVMEMAASYNDAFEEEMVEMDAVYGEKAPTVVDSTSVDSIQRMVIKNADLSVVVDDPLQKLDSVVEMAEGMGGFVVDLNVWQNTLSSGARVPHINVTIRVPAERLNEALDLIKTDVKEIVSENVSGQDITSEYTNLDSRLRNLEAAEAQLQEIMDEARETEDVLQVYNNLVSVREQIEVIKGQMKYYEDAAKLSRISIDITADEEAQPLQIGGWQPVGVAKEAIEVMINTLQRLGDITIWVVLCVVPIGIIIGIPLYFVTRYVQRLRKRKKAEQEPSPQEQNNVLETTPLEE